MKDGMNESIFYYYRDAQHHFFFADPVLKY